MYYNWLDNKSALELRKAQALEVESMMKQSVDMECEYCRERNEMIPINVNSEQNSFKCHKCGNLNKIVVNVSAVRTTRPVNGGTGASEMITDDDNE